MIIRTIRREERERVLDLLHEWISRDFFRRYFDHDPAFRDDLCIVAEDEGRFISTLQIMPKTILIDGSELSLGGIGNVYTTPAYRQQGVASLVLRHAIALMEKNCFDLSMLFASRLAFYGQFGWTSVRRLLGAVAPPPSFDGLRMSGEGRATSVIRAFDLSRDLEAVMDVYRKYSHRRSGPVVRDPAYWRGQLRYAGSPGETFLVAERDGAVAAYARLVDLYDVYNVMEHGAAAGGEGALGDIFGVLAERVRDRGFFLIHLGADAALRETLQARGLGVSEVEDVFWMWRVITPEAVASKLRLSATEVAQPELFDRMLPYRGSVYWTSDRF